MELKKSLFFKFKNFNCELRNIKEDDITIAYISGLKKDKGNIQLLPKNITKKSQSLYINNILESKDKSLCGLFVDDNLVGTVGIQFNIIFTRDVTTLSEKITTFGIFIFLENFRNVGLGKTLVWASTYLIHQCFKEEEFGAGMNKDNLPSIKSFQKCGFRNVFENDEIIWVLLNYSELKKPTFIEDILIKDFF